MTEAERDALIAILTRLDSASADERAAGSLAVMRRVARLEMEREDVIVGAAPAQEMCQSEAWMAPFPYQLQHSDMANQQAAQDANWLAEFELKLQQAEARQQAALRAMQAQRAKGNAE